jgi:hypothetical protein
MQLRMTLAELGMPSIPSLFPIPRIGQVLDEGGRPIEGWDNRRLERFLAEFFWYAHALKRQRDEGTPY